MQIVFDKACDTDGCLLIFLYTCIIYIYIYIYILYFSMYAFQNQTKHIYLSMYISLTLKATH